MDEKIFLASGHVKVTNTRFVVGDQTYAMSSVNSVKITKTDVNSPLTIPGWAVGIGVIWLLVHISSQPTDLFGYLLPLLLLTGGIGWIWNTKNNYEYRLVLTTSSGETPVLVSPTAEDIVPIEKALTDAIIYRG